MRRIGQAIGFAAAVLGVSLFAQTAGAAEDIWGLAGYEWKVGWPGGSSTWCFNRSSDAGYSGQEHGAGNAAATAVYYDTATHVLEMQATSADGRYVAKYTWTLPVDENNLPTAKDVKGTIVFSQPPGTGQQDITISRGSRRPTATCDSPRQ